MPDSRVMQNCCILIFHNNGKTARDNIRLPELRQSARKWLGQCPDCGEWNTLCRGTISPDAASRRRRRRRSFSFDGAGSVSRRSSRRTTPALRPASTSLTAFLAAASSPARSSLSAARPASANRRSLCRWPTSSAATARKSSTFRARNPNGR